MKTPADLTDVMSAVSVAMAAGELSPEEAASAASVIEVHRRALDTHDLAARIAALEAGNAQRALNYVARGDFVRISNGLSRRLELLEARSAGAAPAAVVLVAPHGEAETAAFEIALAERKRANPRQPIIIVDTGISRGSEPMSSNLIRRLERLEASTRPHMNLAVVLERGR